MTTDSQHVESISSGPLNLPLSHYGYVVEDIGKAVEFWASKMKAGPFFLFDHVAFEQVLFNEQPAVFDHSAAFGQWGQTVVELQQLHEVKPATLHEKLSLPINHIAYVSADAPADSERLCAEGFPMYMRAQFGPLDVRFHDSRMLGHSIELHQQSDFLDGFFAGLKVEAMGWDGKEPLREGVPGQGKSDD